MRCADRIDAACEQACRTIAPAWPLDRAIAVNPHWCRIAMPVRRVAARMALLGRIRVFPSRAAQLRAWNTGRITRTDLSHALQRFPAARAAGLSHAQCLEALREEPHIAQLPLLIDVLDDDPRRHLRLSWRQAITHQVSQTCAAYFDQHQADWHPDRGAGLYAFWRDTLLHDHGIGMLMGLPELGRALGALPATRQDAEQWVLTRLGLPESSWADYLEAVLLTVNGWASWCAYLGWQARLEGREDPQLRDLLAIRLAWGAILLECRDVAPVGPALVSLRQAWRHATSELQRAEETLLVDEVWQVALEAGYQRQLAHRLARPVGVPALRPAIEVQAAFCIDVRSEPLRRALEADWPAIETLGCAGFFGLPLAYTPLATAARRPQLPGLLAPTVEVCDRIVPARPDASQYVSDGPGHSHQEQARRARLDRIAWSEQWLSASRWPGAAFSFVEAAGMAYLSKLGQWLTPNRSSRSRDDLAGLPARYQAICRPQIADLDADAKVPLAARVLHAMGLERAFAPLILLVGHGSQSTNNAQAAALDCGACGGQTGEVNCRTLAQLLNEAPVRAGLRTLGIDIPECTCFVAALHNTTTDEIEGFDLDLLPSTVLARWRQAQDALARAGHQVRSERAPRLGLNPSAPQGLLLDQLRRRANDGAQTRPEWGLAGNAAFLIAPRNRRIGLSLEGRCFLHDYDARQDPDGSVLEMLMTAPMLVTHWINWQYHASTCDPVHLGSGNKVLHNVVGGHIGVFEGNGGDLRLGLSRQSLHDGRSWVHEPLRLTVIIDAPRPAIERVLGKHEVVRQLVDNGWLNLWQLDGQQVLQYQQGDWLLLWPEDEADRSKRC
jgi:uncharacterized protein YbcC (UPF0753/DUF2309 family)